MVTWLPGPTTARRVAISLLGFIFCRAGILWGPSGCMCAFVCLCAYVFVCMSYKRNSSLTVHKDGGHDIFLLVRWKQCIFLGAGAGTRSGMRHGTLCYGRCNAGAPVSQVALPSLTQSTNENVLHSQDTAQRDPYTWSFLFISSTQMRRFGCTINQKAGK